ncbi:unnamed protein product [Somion occarium]|uniref:Uncharacterized protein n=1 Tax=Somion occarium TaxID=3059160 RepID=A0ABP1CEX9_9APHY
MVFLVPQVCHSVSFLGWLEVLGMLYTSGIRSVVSSATLRTCSSCLTSCCLLPFVPPPSLETDVRNDRMCRHPPITYPDVPYGCCICPQCCETLTCPPPTSGRHVTVPVLSCSSTIFSSFVRYSVREYHMSGIQHIRHLLHMHIPPELTVVLLSLSHERRYAFTSGLSFRIVFALVPALFLDLKCAHLLPGYM